ncbi:MAG: sigma-70 family RNA polymerase sigma factor [Rhizobacter sp.]|nr:sigma-70 family RNA polymerase sigma factor [Rhizobacter sp.]
MQATSCFRQQLLSAIPRVRRYAHSLVMEGSTADDLVQTTLERALSHWHQFDQRRDIVVWLLSIAHNAHRDTQRRGMRLLIVDPQVLQAQQDQQHSDPGADVGLRMDLLAALQHLTPEQREPLLLVTVEDLSYAECAEVLHIPIGTVMSRISRARAALRILLDGRPAATVHALHRVV